MEYGAPSEGFHRGRSFASRFRSRAGGPTSDDGRPGCLGRRALRSPDPPRRRSAFQAGEFEGMVGRDSEQMPKFVFRRIHSGCLPNERESPMIKRIIIHGPPSVQVEAGAEVRYESGVFGGCRAAAKKHQPQSPTLFATSRGTFPERRAAGSHSGNRDAARCSGLYPSQLLIGGSVPPPTLLLVSMALRALFNCTVVMDPQ